MLLDGGCFSPPPAHAVGAWPVGGAEEVGLQKRHYFNILGYFIAPQIKALPETLVVSIDTFRCSVSKNGVDWLRVPCL
ncbi:MAG: hypothetical protein ACMVO3_23665 [Thalassobaculum sp.]|jgi:hypothetical protein